ncbi:MAG: LapA family protein [Promethearchaeota archaeon]
MITLIIGTMLFALCIIMRLHSTGEVKGEPLGLPKGSVRAIITLLVISFPYGYLIKGTEPPSLIINAIFILITFYFTSRKKKDNKVNRIFDDLRNVEDESRWQPLYLPRYSVRIILVLLIVGMLTLNFYGPQFPFQTTNTMSDILFMILAFFFGAFINVLKHKREKKELSKQIAALEKAGKLDKFEILEKVTDEKPSKLELKGKNALSLLTLVAVLVALSAYLLDFNPGFTFVIFGISNTINFREALLLMINVYYGFRD